MGVLRLCQPSSFLDTAEVPEGICQRYVVTDGLHDLVFGIPEWPLEL